MAQMITYAEFTRRRRRPRNRAEEIRAEDGFVFIEYRSSEDVSLSVHTGGDGEWFEIDPVRGHRPMTIGSAQQQALELAEEHGVGLVVLDRVS
jgi:hypothetical protein